MTHRVRQLEGATDRAIVVKAWSRVYHHRGLAIRNLSEIIGQESTRSSDTTITAIFCLCCAEVGLLCCLTLLLELTFGYLQLRQQLNPDWRVHADGISKLLELRGGFKKLYDDRPYMQPTLILFLM
jgi:hypothetical protein